MNLIINGSYNKINATHRNCSLSNVVFNGSNNKIEVGPHNQNVCNIQNGRNNVIYSSNSNNNSSNRNMRVNNSQGHTNGQNISK